MKAKQNKTFCNSLPYSLQELLFYCARYIITKPPAKQLYSVKLWNKNWFI